MPRRPTSLQFPLRHRRASSALQAGEEEPNAATERSEANGSPVTPKTPGFRPLISSATTPESSPFGPPPKSKRRSTFGAASSAAPNKAVTAAAALQTRAELRARVRSNWSYPHHALDDDALYHVGPKTRIQADTIYAEREIEFASPSPSPSRAPSPPPFTAWNAGAGDIPVVPVSGAHLSHLAEAMREDIDHPHAPAPTPDDPHTFSPRSMEDSAAVSEDHEDDAYRFEDPDAVGAAIQSQREQWDQQEQEERRINPGFRHWLDQRDAWTGAVLLRRNEADGLVRHHELEDAEQGEYESSAGRASNLRPLKRRRRVGQANGIEPGDSSTQAASNGHSSGTASDSAAISSSESAARASTIASSNPDSPLVALVPHPPALIPATHPIRSQITPHAYRSIYTRIIVQGTAPAIPVNLSDIISACVVGWKADGEWPPGATSTALPPGAHKLANPLPAHAGASGLPAEPTHYRGKSDAIAAAVLGSRQANHIREQELEAHSEKQQERMTPKRRNRVSMLVGSIGSSLGNLDNSQDPQQRSALGTDGATDPPNAPMTSLRKSDSGYRPEQSEATITEAAGSGSGSGLVDGRFSAVGRGVRRMGRALKAVGSAMLEPADSMYDADGDVLDTEVPGLVQGELGGTFDQVEIGRFERREF